MKISNKIFLFIGIISLLITSSVIKAQSQSIEIPTDGSVNVYLVNGATRKFDIYNKETRITALRTAEYTIYNIQPGEHIFWTAENPSNFLKGNFEANSTYVVALEAPDSAVLFGVVGVLTAGAKMMVFDPNEFRHKKLFYQVVKRFKKVDLDGVLPKNNEEMVKKALDKYNKFSNEKQDKILVITPEMKFMNADKPIRK